MQVSERPVSLSALLGRRSAWSNLVSPSVQTPRAGVADPSGRELTLGGFWGRRLHGRARQRERPRLRLGLALRLRSRLRRSSGLLVGEDVFLRLARQQPLELVFVDRLALDQDPRELVQLVH